jgi:hypothetical protein
MRRVRFLGNPKASVDRRTGGSANERHARCRSPAKSRHAFRRIAQISPDKLVISAATAVSNVASMCIVQLLRIAM